MDMAVYGRSQQQASQRIEMLDANEWPVLACAMVLGCPVWTEETNFYGTSVATWTTDRIALYLGGCWLGGCINLTQDGRLYFELGLKELRK